MSSIQNNNLTPQTLGANAFSNVSTPFVINVPAGSKAAYKKAANWSTYAANFHEFGQFTANGICYEVDGTDDDTQVSVVAKSGSSYTGAVAIPASFTYNEIEYKVTAIGEAAFKGCTGLTSVEIPASVTKIGDSAFEGCTKLSSIKNNNLTPQTLGTDAFLNVSTSFVINVPAGRKAAYKKAANWSTYAAKFHEFGQFTAKGICYEVDATDDTQVSVVAKSGSSYTGAVAIPASFTYNEIEYKVTAIGEAAFKGCTGLTSVEIPASVTKIGDSAFEGCTGLQKIENYRLTPQTINANVFDGVTKSKVTLNVPFGTSGDYKVNDVWKDFNNINERNYSFVVNNIYYAITTSTEDKKTVAVTSKDAVSKSYSGAIVIPASVEFGNNTFSVTSIKNDAFNSCTGLKSIKIPISVTSIGDYAFTNCTSLQSISIPDSVTSIGEAAFWFCSGLTSVTIGNSVTSIGDNTFNECSGLTSVTIGNSVTSIGNSTFCNCQKLQSIKIPDSVTSIGNSTFCGCIGLQSIDIPSSVTSIGEGAFINCTSLQSIEIPNSVTSIGYCAFLGCTSLQSIKIPDSVTSIGKNAFQYCYGLTSVTIGNSVTSIGDAAFWGCIGLQSIDIPNSVTSIGEWAFCGCTGLEKIYNYSLTPQAISANVFDEVTTSNVTLYVPLGASEEYKKAEVWKDYFTDNTTKEFKDVTISSAEMPYASLYSPVALTMPEGLTAYTGKDNDTSVHLDDYLTVGQVLPKLTGVVLTGAPGTYRFIQADEEGTAPTSDNCFKGLLEDTPKSAPCTVLGFVNNTPGFYNFTGDTLSAYKIYIAGDKPKSIIQNTTGITDIDTDLHTDKAEDVYYNLDGTRANTLKSGHIYIRNSKKLIIR